jgi:hypothetical protein
MVPCDLFGIRTTRIGTTNPRMATVGLTTGFSVGSRDMSAVRPVSPPNVEECSYRRVGSAGIRRCNVSSDISEDHRAFIRRVKQTEYKAVRPFERSENTYTMTWASIPGISGLSSNATVRNLRSSKCGLKICHIACHNLRAFPTNFYVHCEGKSGVCKWQEPSQPGD